MAWTTPRTWVDNETPGGSTFNTHVRDNLNALRDYLLGAQDLGSNWKISSGRVLDFQDSDVAHGMTTIVPTDVYAAIREQSATAGGVNVMGLRDDDAPGLQLYGYNGSATGTQGGLWINAAKKNGTSAQAFSASELAMLFVNGGSSLGGYYGSGLNVVGGLSVGYSAAPVSGALTVGDANFKAWLDTGNNAPTITLDGSGASIVYNRTTSGFQFSGAGGVGIFGGDATSGFYSYLGIRMGVTGWSGGNAPEGCILWQERTDPAAPAANKALIYCKDNGAGKTQIVALFSSGAVQLIAQQP